MTYAAEDRIAQALTGYNRKTISVDADDLRCAMAAISAARDAFNQLAGALRAEGVEPADSTFGAYRLTGLGQAPQRAMEKAWSMRPIQGCLTCWGAGQGVRESSRGKLYAWPCPHGCPAPIGTAVIRTHAR